MRNRKVAWLLLALSAGALAIGIRGAVYKADPIPPGSAASERSGPAAVSPAAPPRQPPPSLAPALPGAVPLDQIQPPPVSPSLPRPAPPTWAAPPEVTTHHLPPSVKPSPPARPRRPAPPASTQAPSRSEPPPPPQPAPPQIATPGSGTEPDTPGPVVIFEQPDGQPGKLMRTYRQPDGTVIFVPES
jgi:hypothetical protein